jgi:predicted nucleotidyltransferase
MSRPDDKPTSSTSTRGGRGVEDDSLLAEIVRRLVNTYLPEQIYLFGSRARGDSHGDSDYDLLVIVADLAPPDRRDSIHAYRALRGTGTAADVIVMTRSYFDWMLDAAASLPATVQREGRVVYAS